MEYGIKLEMKSEEEFGKFIKHKFCGYDEYFIKDYFSEEGLFYTPAGTTYIPHGDYRSAAGSLFHSHGLLRVESIKMGLCHLMEPHIGLVKHWHLEKIGKDEYSIYIEADITEPAYLINGKSYFEKDKRDKEEIDSYLEECKKNNTKPCIMKPIKGVSWAQCTFKKVRGESRDDEVWFDRMYHNFILGRPENYKELLNSSLSEEQNKLIGNFRYKPAVVRDKTLFKE